MRVAVMFLMHLDVPESYPSLPTAIRNERAAIAAAEFLRNPLNAVELAAWDPDEPIYDIVQNMTHHTIPPSSIATGQIS